MCEEERFTLQTLLVETYTQSKLFKEKDSPYLQSLERGIQTAQTRLQTCEYKQCMSQFYDVKLEPTSIQKLNLQLAKEKIDIFTKCVSLI